MQIAHSGTASSAASMCNIRCSPSACSIGTPSYIRHSSSLPFAPSMSIFASRVKEDPMQKTQLFQAKRKREVEIKISHLSLPSLLPPGCILALNPEIRTLSLLSDGPLLIVEQQFSDNEMRIMVPILKSFPYYCPYEVLLSHLSSNIVNAISIANCRQRLEEAQNLGTWPQELRPIRRALSSLRNKLHYFNLEISTVRERGCSLTSLTL